MFLEYNSRIELLKKIKVQGGMSRAFPGTQFHIFSGTSKIVFMKDTEETSQSLDAY